MNEDLGINGYLGWQQGQANALNQAAYDAQLRAVQQQQYNALHVMQNATTNPQRNPDEALLVLLTED